MKEKNGFFAKTAIMIQVTTTDSEIPPKTGSFKTVLQFSSSINVSVRFPVLLPPFSLLFYYRLPFVLGIKKAKKKEGAIREI